MSAALIWFIFPLVLAAFFWFIQSRTRLVFWLSVLFCFLLGLIALLQPIGGLLKIGSTSLQIKESLLLFGREFTLQNSDRFFLVFIYFGAIFWFVGAQNADVPPKFIPLSLAILALLTAALAVEPFLYSAVLIELAVIVSLPLLLTAGEPIGKGVLRYFIYQSLAMPFILFAGWVLSGSQANSSDFSQLTIAALLLGLGFAFLIAVFPFHVWMPELASETHPYIAGFLLGTLPPVYLLILLKFLNGLVWLKDAAFLPTVLQTVGGVMIVTGGLWAAVQTDLKRIFGFAVIIESGFSLLCISLHSQIGNELFYLSLIPHLLVVALFAYALAILQRRGFSSDLRELGGQVRNLPVLSLALLSAMLSIAGLPLFAGFPLNIELFEQFPANSSLLAWSLVGLMGMMIAAFRLLVVLVGNNRQKWSVYESRADLFFLLIGIFVLVLMGTVPSLFIGGVWKTFSALLTLT